MLEGKKGVGQLAARSQPVQESLKPTEAIEQDLEKAAERRASTDFVEAKDEKSSGHGS